MLYPILLSLPMASALLMRPVVTPRTSVAMQYGGGQQQGYGGQQQGGQQGGQQMGGQMGGQQGYGQQMGGQQMGGQQMGGQQMGGQAPIANPNAWYIFPRDGAGGLIQNDYQVLVGQEQVAPHPLPSSDPPYRFTLTTSPNHFALTLSSTYYPSPLRTPHHLQVLGSYDLQDKKTGQMMGGQQLNIQPEQCAVQVAPDASCVYLYALGSQPTGWRSRPDEPWNWLQPGQSQALYHHWKISLDYAYPEQAVYKLAEGKKASTAGPCWDYVSQYQNGGQGGQQMGGQMGGQQQGGQQGYGQQQGGQQGYGQQQGGQQGGQQGYGQQQQGGYGGGY